MATNFVKASYSEVYDLHTEAGRPTVIGVHVPRSNNPYRFLTGFFTQFRKYKYAGSKLTFIPVSTLPADPLQVSYEAGEPTIDPRDMVNPILYKGIHGDSLGHVLDDMLQNQTEFRGSAIDAGAFATAGGYEALYYQALSDASFGKAHVQRGFTKSMYPLVYDMASTRQLGPALLVKEGANPANDVLASSPEGFNNLGWDTSYVDNAGTYNGGVMLDQGNYGVLTPHMSRLGWLDTMQIIRPKSMADVSAGTNAPGVDVSMTPVVNILPKVFMLLIMLPPAYKTEMYFRVVIKHYFEFRDFRSAPFYRLDSAYQSLLSPYAGPAEDFPASGDVSEPGGVVLEPVDANTLEVQGGEATLVTDGVM